MTRFLHIYIVLIFLALGCVLGNEALAKGNSNKPEYTVMVYLMGSDLEKPDDPSATNCILEMAKSNMTSSVNLLIATGGVQGMVFRHS